MANLKDALDNNIYFINYLPTMKIKSYEQAKLYKNLSYNGFMMNINNNDFLNGAKLNLPSSEKEQTKIANFLTAIDDKIEGVAKELEGVKKFKKGLLQQMFV